MRFLRLNNFLFSKSKISVLICPDKFKFSMTSQQVSQIIKKNTPSNFGRKILGLADGGQGSLDLLSKKIDGQWIECQVFDPLFKKIKAKYYIGQNKESYIEMARASGLQLLQPLMRNPLQTSSFGTGQLIIDSLTRGCKKINLLIGGSATNDGGIGMAKAMGYSFTDINGDSLKTIGKNLIKIKSIRFIGDIYNQRNKPQINVYTDVTNIFTGINGATRIYGPQKGANPTTIQQLEKGMINLRQIFKELYKVDVNQIQGSGAAGGIGGMCYVLLNSKLKRGIDLIFSINDFQNWVQKSDLIVTGQGKVDGQTMNGKVVSGVLEIAKKYNKKVLIVCAFCQNRQQIQRKLDDNVKILQLLENDQREIIDPKLTKYRLSQRIKQYFTKYQ